MLIKHEKTILLKLDQLLELLKAIQAGENKESAARELITEMNLLFQKLLPAKTLPLKQIYSQLIKQRAQENADELLAVFFTLSNLQAPPTISGEINLARVIATFYPHEKIIKNYTLRSITFDYYLPGKKIAFLLVPVNFKPSAALKLILKKTDLNLVEITPREKAQPQLLYQKLAKKHHSQ